MLGQVFASLRLRLFLLVLLVCAPLAGVVVYSAWHGRSNEVEAWAERSQGMMRLAAREEARLIGQTRQLLLAMAESSQVRLGNPRDCKKLLDDLIGSYPRYANLSVINVNGELLASALVPAAASQSESQRGAERLVAKPATASPPVAPFDYRLFRRVVETHAFAIGDFPAQPASRKPTVSFGCPVFDGAGQVQSVVIAALDLNWVNRFESEMMAQLPKGASWTEITPDGVVLVRYPSPEKWFGQPLPEQTLLKTVRTREPGVVEAGYANGAAGIHAFASRPGRLLSGRVITILSIPADELFAGLDHLLFQNLVGLGIAAGLALLLGWFGSTLLVLRPVKALAQSSARLAAGDLSARTGFPHGRDELGELTRTFDQMAQVLEHHETERERVREKLQVLSRRLVTAQENERRHIARELHDQIGQALTVAQMNLQAVMKSANGRARATRLKDCLDMVESTLAQVHDLSLNLRPSMLDDLGLAPALRWLTERQASLAGLRHEFKEDHLSNQLDPVVKTECFRVAQEALTNVIRHAKARRVTVALQRDDGLLHLRVCDDGVGFDVKDVRESAVRGASLGLLSMEERASLAGGGLAFRSAPGQGTEVHAWFPTRMPIPKAFAGTVETFDEDHSNHSG